MTVKINGTNTAADPAFTGADTDTGLQCGTDEVNLVTGGTARVTVDSSGNVGIGTTSPAITLDVHGADTNANGTGDVKGQLRVFNDTTAFGSSPRAGIVFSTKYRTSPDIPLDGAAIYGGKENSSDANKDFFLAFATRDESPNEAVERMRLDSSGRLNIGATSNSYTGAGLQVNNSVGSFFVTDNSHLLLQNKNSSTTNWWNIAPRDDGTLTVGNGAPGSTGIVTDRKLTIRSDGVVLVGKTSPSYSTQGIELDPDDWITATNNGLCLRLNRTGTDGEVAQFMNDGSITGRIQVSGSSTSYNTSSDYRLKENVVDLDGAIDRVKQLAPKRFNFINDADTTLDGFLAHEAQTVVPEAITGTHNGVEVWTEDEELPEGVSVGDNKLDEDGNTIPVYQGIDQSKLVPLLTAALQEAIAKIETLETKVAALEATE